MKILLTGGGTGGHIVPLLSIVSEIRKNDREEQKQKTIFQFIGTKSDFNKSLSDADINIKIIQAGKLRRYFSLENFTDIFRFFIGFLQSLFFIQKFQPDVVFSKGGFASVPPVVAAWFLKVPIITHESDIVPGLANRIISKFSNKVLISFYASKKYFSETKVILTGNPIRKDILQGDKEKAKIIFDLKENIPTILIFGGSQGAQKINEVILQSLPKLLDKFQIIHVCGKHNYEKLKSKVEQRKSQNFSRYRLYPFLFSKLKEAFAISNVIISRAGANSLFEIIALQKPSIVIPLPSAANNHQMKNAKFFQDRKMIILIEEKNLNEKKLGDNLSRLLAGDKLREQMIIKMKEYNNFISRNPVLNIVSEIYDFDFSTIDFKK